MDWWKAFRGFKMIKRCPFCDSKDIEDCSDVGKGTYQCQSCGNVINTQDDETDDEELYD